MITYGSTTLTSYNTITKIEVYYYKSTSSTDLAGGSWSTTKPTWENGKYIWQKIRTTYEGKLANGQFYSESDPVNITGQQGATGTAAYSYKLNASDNVIGKTKTGEYTIDKITFTATYKQGTGAVTAYTGRFKIETTANGTTWTTQYTSSGNESSKEYTIPEDIISVRCSLYQSGGTNTLLDITTIPIVKDGIDAIGLRDSIPYYLASDKQTGVTRLDQGWTRFKPELTTEKRYLWVYYVSRYSEGDTQPELIEIKNDIISFENHGDESPVENCVIDIEPVQDLHGYDSPWLAGGGKNKLLFSNSDMSETINGITASYDATTELFTVTGTETLGSAFSVLSLSNVLFKIPNFVAGETYTISRTQVTGELDKKIYVQISYRKTSGTTGALVRNDKESTTFTVPSDFDYAYNVFVGVYAGASDLNNAFKIQLESGSTATSWTPYENLCPISGTDTLTVTTAGKNLFGGDVLADKILALCPNAVKDTANKTIRYAGSEIKGKSIFGEFKPNTQYTFILTVDASSNNVNMRVLYTDGTNQSLGNGVFVTPANKSVEDFRGVWATGHGVLKYEECGIFEGALTADQFESYQGNTYTIEMPTEAGTVYGGTLNVTTGVLTVDRAMVDLGTLSYAQDTAGTYGRFYTTALAGLIKGGQGSLNFISSAFTATSSLSLLYEKHDLMWLSNTGNISFSTSGYTNANDFKKGMSGQTVVYELATPITYTLTPQEITMLTGQNHIFSDTGQTAISYYDNQTSTDPYVDYSATSAFEYSVKAYEATQPLFTKTYTELIGSANDAANASFYFAKIHPTSYTTNYKVKMKVCVTEPEAYAETIDIQFGGYGSTFSSYDSYTTRTDSVGVYYINLYRATQAGVTTNHKGHALGVGLRSSTNPTNTSYKRTIIVDILELENCTIEMLDTAVKYANIDGTGSTNYSGLTEMSVATAGQNATNNANYYDRTLYNQAVKAGSAGYTSTHIVCGTSAGYINIGANVNFDIGYPLLYSTVTVTNGNTANNHYLNIPGVNFSINGTIEVGTAYKMLYLKGTLTGSTFTIASSPFMTTVVPNTPDGFYYIPLGEMSSATIGRFVSSDKLYAYLNGAFQAVDTAAQKLAEAAQAKAVEALTSANNKNKIYYSTSAPTGGTYIDGDTWFDTDDDNSVHIYNGSTKKWVKQQLGENAIADASISNAKIANATIQSAKIANLDGAKIVANTITANKLATDAIKSNNYLASSNTFSPYSATGTFLDLATGNIYTPNFGVDSVNGGAYINGQVVASTGQIGDSAINYWQIGSHIDYNMNPSAAIIGHGTSFIQSGQWQISNNRINTQTYDDQNKITYLHYNSKYWDYGMQVPELDTTKSTYIDGVSNNWLYIRRSTADSIPALENNWEYLFRVDKDGTVYENGVKLSEKYASIDGVSGAYLPRSGGTITGNLTVNGTLTATASKANALSHTLSINGQSWSGSANLTINTLGVAYGGTGKTTGVDAANYFLNSLSTGSDIPHDNDYYISQYVNGGTTTTTFHRRPVSKLWEYVKSKLSAADIYVPKTGGTFTGAVHVEDEFYTDSATLGNLIVNGNANFTNGLRATNINGGQVIYTVIGTQTATTAAWTGELPINELYDGLTIAYYLPRTSANNVTLKLTLANGEETAAIPVYVTSTTRMTTHYGAGSTILLTYWSKGSVSINGTATTEDRWTSGDYWDGNTVGEYGGSCIAGEHGMARYSLIIQTGHDVWESLVTTSTTATTKAKSPSGFLITSPILYQNGDTYAEGGIAEYSSCWSTAQNIDTRYSFNVSTTWSSNGRSLYLVGTISGDKFTLKDTTWWADELPETNDGYYYWYIGQMASAYAYTLHPVHPIYYYDGGIKVLNIGALTSSQVTDALGYTPYNATNPNGYTTNKGTVTSVRVQASAPLQSSTNTAQGTTLDTTISFANQNKNLVLASPSSGNAGAPTFRSLVSDDIPSLAWSKITSGNDDLKAIEALTGTSGFLKKTAANTWSLDTNTYLTTHQTVTDKNATLTWGAATTVATIGSTNINVSLPSNPNNHYTANLITGASNSAKANAAATNGNVFLNLIENSTVRNYHNLKGGNGLTVTSDANGVVTFTSPAAFTGVSFSDGKLTFTKSDGNTAEILTDDFVITQATGATGLVNSSGQGLNVGGVTTKPVYFKNGIPTEITSIPYTLLTGAPTSMTPTAHTHGNIQNGGTLQTSDITVGNGDKIVVTDSSNSHKVARSSIAFDGSTKTQALTKAGTWETFNNYSLPLAASGTRGGVKIGYTSSGKNYAVQLSDEKMYVNVPWTDTTYSAGTGLSLSGTTFNHSNSVTAGTVGSTVATSSTDRTITIPYVTYDAQGHITKTGTHTHTITSYPEAYLSWGGRNFAGSYGCIDAAMIPRLGANRFAFLHAAGIEAEYSRDNGETWIDYEATDEAKTGLFGASSSFFLGKATSKADNKIENQLRITITTNLAGIYTTLNKIAIYMNTQGNTTFVKMERAPQSDPTNYTTHLDWTQIEGWSGWNILNISGITTYGNTASQYQKIRFIFKQTAISTNYASAIINRIMGFGGMGWTVPSNMAREGHLYTYDNSQNAIFPANITATTFIGALNGNATSATSADSATKATQDSDGHQINTTYLKLAGGTMTGVLTAKAGQYTDSYSGALNMNNSNIYGVNAIYTADSSDNAQEGIHFYRSATTVDSLHAKAGVLYFTPNRTLGQAGTSYTVYHTGNKPSKSDVGLGNVDNTADANKVVKGVSVAAGTSNAYRHVWFSDSATETSRNNDADFTYNPSTNDLKVPSVTGTTMNLSNWKIEQDSSTESLMFRYMG